MKFEHNVNIYLHDSMKMFSMDMNNWKIFLKIIWVFFKCIKSKMGFFKLPINMLRYDSEYRNYISVLVWFDYMAYQQ